MGERAQGRVEGAGEREGFYYKSCKISGRLKDHVCVTFGKTEARQDRRMERMNEGGEGRREKEDGGSRGCFYPAHNLAHYQINTLICDSHFKMIKTP